jgi:hypothetical protein
MVNIKNKQKLILLSISFMIATVIYFIPDNNKTTETVISR